MSRGKGLQKNEVVSLEVCSISREELFDLMEMFQEQMETMHNVLKQILARILALE